MNTTCMPSRTAPKLADLKLCTPKLTPEPQNPKLEQNLNSPPVSGQVALRAMVASFRNQPQMSPDERKEGLDVIEGVNDETSCCLR